MITPAISVLSAVEGVKVVVPSLESLVLPITIAVLVVLFTIQRFGTHVIGRVFGPVMVVWFSVIAAAGLARVLAHPEIVKALSPHYGVEFFGNHFGIAFISLGAIVLDDHRRRGALRRHGPLRPSSRSAAPGSSSSSPP